MEGNMAIHIDKSKGYIIVWRSILETPLWTNPKLQRLFFWVLLRANYKTKEVFPTTEKIMLQPGQFVTSYPHISKELRISVGSVKTYLDLLKSENIIETKPTNKYTVITIQNWNELQNPEKKNESKVKTERKQTETDNTDNTFNSKKASSNNSSQDKDKPSENSIWDLANRLSDKQLAKERMSKWTIKNWKN